ncbi:MAG: hypothetical protein ACYC35_04960 [Pirellulales bacterium]
MSTVINPGCVVFLMDESAGMNAQMQDVVTDGQKSTKSNAERVTTALNAVLNQLASGADFDVAVVGYQADGAGQVNVGSRWGGALAGRDFVSTGELAGAPLRVETRTRKIPALGGMGVAREEPVSFPVWYAPTLGVKAPQIAAFDYCRELLTRWAAGAGDSPATPVVVHVFSGASGDGNPQLAVNKLLELALPGGPPLVFQVHLSGSAAAVTSQYPSNPMYLTLGSSRDLFRRASSLPAGLIAALKASKVSVNANARAMIYNAKIADVIRLFGLVKTWTKDWPSKPSAVLQPAGVPDAVEVPAAEPAEQPAEAETALAPGGEPAEAPCGVPGAEKAALVVMLLDRSVEDPYGGNVQNPCAKLQDHANDLLKQVSKLADGTIDAAIVSYGLDSAGQVEVRDTFDGPLAGKTLVPHTDLAAGALRVDEFEEQVPNGVGGLITVNRKKPIYLEVEPTAAAPPAEAFAAVARIVSEWCAQHPAACAPPVVLHLTRGCQALAELAEAAAALRAVSTAAGPVALYHLVVTESPQKALAYPAAADEIEDPALRALWELSSPLLGRERLAAEKPTVKPDSRGMVINAKFDLLLEGVKNLLAS